MMTVAPQASHRHSDKDVTMVPGADCIADSAGGLTFDITDPGPGAAAGDTHLVLRHRDGVREVRLPLTPAADGRLRAALPSSVELPEGRWDAYAQVADGEPQRLAPGLNDLRSLVDRVPSGARGHVAVRIPYGTKHGNLSVRSWLRAPTRRRANCASERRSWPYGARCTASSSAPTPTPNCAAVRSRRPWCGPKSPWTRPGSVSPWPTPS